MKAQSGTNTGPLNRNKRSFTLIDKTLLVTKKEPQMNCGGLFSPAEIKESKLKVQAVKKLIQELPKPNRDTMKLLFSHLHR